MTDHYIIPISTSDDEEDQRIVREAERLANQSAVERALWLSQPHRFEPLGKALGISPERVIKSIKAALAAILKEREAARKVEQKREHELAEQQRRSEDEERRRIKLQQEQQRVVEQRAEQDRLKAAKEAERRVKLKAKGFTTIARLPVARHEKQLERLAGQLGEDLAVLRVEFKDYLGVEGEEPAPRDTEPLPEPVDLATLLSELSAKVSRYIVFAAPYQMTAAVLFTTHNWLYDHGVPVHSPILAATSAEANCGKSTLVEILGRASPRFKLNVDTTGPTLYRYVDKYKPTIGLDEADDIFTRRSDLKHIINAGWTRGAKIPRQEKINGVYQTIWFDPFTPKLIALLGSNLPQATRTRCIELRMVPKRPDETVEDFNQEDDAEFALLRRKFARFAADHAVTLKDAKPVMPAGLHNRAAANWKLLLAIAELAGGPWPDLAREAAVRLTRSRHRPSNGVRLLSAFKKVFEESWKPDKPRRAAESPPFGVFTSGRTVAITSEDMVKYLCLDPTSVWLDYNRGGPITQRQIAILLDQYEINPMPLHPTGRGDFCRMGYTLEQLADAIARHVPETQVAENTSRDPIIQSRAKTPGKRRAPKRRSKQRKRARKS